MPKHDSSKTFLYFVSFPSWSEETQSGTSKKTIFEEALHRIEDERYNLDHLIESNASTIRALEAQEKKLKQKPDDDRDRYTLDDKLGGTSEAIHKASIRRIYGDSRSEDIIEALKSKPTVAIPLILKRLKAKDQEWQEAKRKFAKFWREDVEKNYERSLDCQGHIFKQADLRQLKQKKLLNEIESVMKEQRRGERGSEKTETFENSDHNDKMKIEKIEIPEKMLKNEKSDKIDKPDNLQDPLKPTNSAKSSHSRSNSPLFDDIFKENSHMALPYTDKDIIDDAALLIIHYVKRMSNINKDEKTKMKAVINRLQSGFLNCRNLFTFITQNSSFEVIFEANKCNSRPKFWV